VRACITLTKKAAAYSSWVLRWEVVKGKGFWKFRADGTGKRRGRGYRNLSVLLKFDLS